MMSGCCLIFWGDNDEDPQQTEQGEQEQGKPQAGQAGEEGRTPSGQTGTDGRVSTQPRAPVALPGKHPAAAEKAYAEALALWRPMASGPGDMCSDPSQALALLDKAITLAPGYGEALILRGRAKSDLGQHEEAFEDITAGLRIAPSPGAYAVRGLVLLKKGQLKAARRDLEYSLQRAPSQHRAWNYMGLLSVSEGEDKEACKAFKKGCDNGECSFLESAKKEKICS